MIRFQSNASFGRFSTLTAEVARLQWHSLTGHMKVGHYIKKCISVLQMLVAY